MCLHKVSFAGGKNNGKPFSKCSIIYMVGIILPDEMKIRDGHKIGEVTYGGTTY